MNQLTYLDDFREVLTNYKFSPAVQRLLDSTRLAFLVAATSSGRNTLIRELVKTGEYYYILSDTTRKPRINNDKLELDGVEYWFRSEEEVLKDLKAGQYLEAAVIHKQQVSGVSARELQKSKDSGRVGITDIEVAGADAIVKVKPDAKIVFVIPPDFDTWLHRLERRGKMHPVELKRRMESAVDEFTHALERDYYSFVVNDSLELAVEHVHEIVFSENPESRYQEQSKKAIIELIEKTKAYIKGL
jgi:guanylate kinase